MATSRNIRFGDLVRASGRPQVVTLWTDPNKDRAFTQAVQSGRVLTVVHEPRSKHKDFGLVGLHKQPHASYLVFPRPLEKPAGSRVIGINYLLLEEPEVRDPVRPSPRPEPRGTKRKGVLPNPTPGASPSAARRSADFSRRKTNVVPRRAAEKAQSQKTLPAFKRVKTRSPADGQNARKSGRSPSPERRVVDPSTLNSQPATSQKPPTRAYTFSVRRTATLETDVIVEAETQKAARERALTSVKTQPFDIQKASVREEIIHTK